MRGIVLAAGGGTRLRPLTDELPKTLLPVTPDGRSVLDLAITNLREVGIREVTIVTGHAASAIEALTPDLEARYDVELDLRFNDRFDRWNNAYSVWLVRDVIEAGAILINGDTVHPADVERRLLRARGTAPILVAIDDDKLLAEEEMKVKLIDGSLAQITKMMDPNAAHGEYIGVTLFEPAAMPLIAESLEATFGSDPGLYYEDGYQEFVDRGGRIDAVSIGAQVRWVEIDDHADLARARGLTTSA